MGHIWRNRCIGFSIKITSHWLFWCYNIGYNVIIALVIDGSSFQSDDYENNSFVGTLCRTYKGSLYAYDRCNISNEKIILIIFLQDITSCKSHIWKTLLILTTLCRICSSSSGDCSIIFAQCLYSCRVSRCNYPGDTSHALYTPKPFVPRNLTLLERVITWKCDDECKYHCMWWSVEKFQASGVPPQQFYGRVSTSNPMISIWVSFNILWCLV